MTFNSIMEILDFAIEKEQEAVHLYQTLSELEPFEGIGDLFKEFADEEKKHEKMLLNMKNSNSDKKIEKYTTKNVLDLKRSDYLINIDYAPGISYRDSLILAMKREEKSVKLYHDLKTQVEGGEEQKLFTILEQEEEKHKLRLEKMYDDYELKMGD